MEHMVEKAMNMKGRYFGNHYQRYLDADSADKFGTSVSIDTTYAMVGSQLNDPIGLQNSGAVYVFSNDGSNWTQTQKLYPADGSGGDLFGHDVSLGIDYLAVGAFSDDDNGVNSGSAYIYEKDPVGLFESIVNDGLRVYPNPANQELNISAAGFDIDEIIFYTVTGQQVYFIRPNSETIDISTLQPGTYIVEVTVEGRKIRQKLLIQR